MKTWPEMKLVAAFMVGLALMYMLRPASGVEIERRRVDKVYKSRIDSLGRLLVVQRQLTEMYAQEGLKSAEQRRKAEAARDSVIKQTNDERRKYKAIVLRRYADHEYDSVLSALWPE